MTVSFYFNRLSQFNPDSVNIIHRDSNLESERDNGKEGKEDEIGIIRDINWYGNLSKL